jgi:DNA-binding transcriptional LysR family regulator
MAFTIRQLQFFVAVAETGSVSRAAKSLSISQSAITESIKLLEVDLGLKLFDRHSRGLNITHKGHQFLRYATSILSEVSEAKRALTAQDIDIYGSLHVGVTPLMAGYVLSGLLSKYRRVNPEVDVSVIEENGEHLEHLLIGGELDVAVMVISNLHDTLALQVEILDVSPYRLWLPIGHRLLRQQSISLEDLKGEPLIVLDIDEMGETAVKLLSTLGQRPKIAFRTRSVEAVRSLVATGGGIAVLPHLVYRPWSLEGDRIESRDISGALSSVKVGLAWRKGSPLSAAAKDFITIIQDNQSGKMRY